MNMTTKAEQNALTLPQRAAVALGAAEHEVKLRELVKSSADIVAVIDPAGREQAHRIGMTLKNARVSIEKTGKAAREDATAFSKAVIAEEKRLVDIVTGEENRVFSLRDEFDAKVEAERQAKIAAERARVDAIQARIAIIQQIPIDVAGMNAAYIKDEIDHLKDFIIDASFEEFSGRAAEVKAETLAKLVAMMDAAIAKEQAEANAKAEREAEAKRLTEERAELAKLRAEAAERDRIAKIESDRIAAEQAAEAKRLANLAAEQRRIAAEEQAAANAELKAAQDRLNEERAAFLRQQNEAAEAEAERIRLQAAADQMLADAHTGPIVDLMPVDLTVAAETSADESLETVKRPTNQELVEVIAAHFDVSSGVADEWLSEFESVKF